MLHTHATRQQSVAPSRVRAQRALARPGRSHHVLQRKCACGGGCPKCETEQSPLNRSADGSDPTSVPPIVHEVLRSPSEPLDAATRAFMEPRFGQDFSRIAVRSASYPRVGAEPCGVACDQPSVIQPKSFEVSDPVGPDERQADEIARKVADGRSAEIKGAGVAPALRETLPETTADFPSQLAGRNGGRALDNSVRNEMETKIGTSFSDVRVHSGTDAQSMADSLNARAFTCQRDVFFGAGEYNPDSRAGKELLAHELVHTVQQGGGLRRKAKALDVDSALNWYAGDPYGKKIVFSPHLAMRLYEVSGAKAEYDAAIAEATVGRSFVELVSRAQIALKTEPDGKFGPGTQAALDKWRTGGPHGIDYNRLLKDKKLDIGVAIGVEFVEEHEAIKTLLTKYKFKTAADSKVKTTYSKAMKLKVPGDDSVLPIDFEIGVDLIYQDNDNPKATFMQFLSEKDVAIYSGHARYGTGPDFDAKESPDQNFVIGVNSAKHGEKSGGLTKGYDPHMNELLKGRQNDLEQMSKAGKFDETKYQVWMFNACVSKQYLDEVRGGLVTNKKGDSKSGANLRFFGTTATIYSDCVPILEELISLNSIDDIIETMNTHEIAKVKEQNKLKSKAEQEPLLKSYYFAD